MRMGKSRSKGMLFYMIVYIVYIRGLTMTSVPRSSARFQVDVPRYRHRIELWKSTMSLVEVFLENYHLLIEFYINIST